MNAKVGEKRRTLQQVAGPGRRVAVLPDGPAWRLHLALLAQRALATEGRAAARLHHQRGQIFEQELADPLRAGQAWAAALAADPDFGPARLAARHLALELADDARLAALLEAGAADDEDRVFHAAVWGLRWPTPSRVVEALADAGDGPEVVALGLLTLPCTARRLWLEARAEALPPVAQEVLAAARMDAGAPPGVALDALAAQHPLAAWLAVEATAGGDATAQAQALAALAQHAEGPTAAALWFLVAERLPPPADAAYARAAEGSLDDVIALLQVLRAPAGPARAQAVASCRLEDPTLQAVLALRLALAREQAGDADGAWHAAQYAWRLRPTLAGPHLARAARAQGALGDWAALTAEGPPPADATERFVRACLLEHGLGDAAAARAVLGEPGELGASLPALRAAQRLATPDDCRALQVEARGARAERQGDLYLQVARAYLAQPDGLDKALTYLFWVLDADPDHPTALRLAVQACQAAGRIGPLAEVLTRWLALVQAPADRVPALQAMADLFERTGQPAGDAADLLAEAFALAPDTPGLAADLERTLAAAGRVEALADLYRSRMHGAPDGPSKASLGLRLGLLLESHLADAAAAAEAYAAALAAGPDPDTRARLEGALARVRPDETEEHTLTDVGGGGPEFDVPLTDPGEQPGSAAEEFEALLTRHSQVTQTLDLPPLAPPAPLPQIERGAAAPPEDESWSAEPPAPQASVTDSLSEFLGEEVSRPAEADPARAAVRRRLANTRARASGGVAWPGRELSTVDAAVAALEAAEDPTGRFEAACALGRAYEAAGDAQSALRAWREALAWQAGAPEPERHLEALYRQTGARLPLAELLAGQAHRTADPARRRAVLVEVARIHAEDLGDPGAAVDHLREALAAGGPDPALAHALAEHLRACQRWPEYLEALAAAGRTAPDPDDPEWTLQVGRIHLYERRDAAAALPYVVAAARALPDRVDVAADVAEARAELGQVDAAVALLEQCLAGLVGRGWASQRATLAQRLARLLERADGDPERARAAWRAAIEDGVREPAVLDRCERLATQAHDWDTLAVVLQAALDEAEARRAPASEQRDLAVRLGHVLHRRLDRPREAAEAYARGYALDPSDEQVFRAARGLAERLGLTAVQVPLYRTWLAHAAPEAPERLGVGLALVTALEESEAPDEAVAEVEALAADFPTVPAVANARERVLRAAGRWDTLAQLYRVGVLEAPNDEVRAERLQRLAHAEEVGLRDLAAATATWRQVLALAPEHARALAAIARLLEAQKAWPGLLEVSAAQLAVTPEPRRRAQVLFRMGSLLETKLGDLAAAAERYREAVAADPRCFPALHGLRDLAAQAGDWAAVIENLRVELGLWDDPKERAAVLARIGEIEARRRHDQAAALASYREALATWPESVPAARYLADRAFAEGRHADAAPLFQMLCNQKLEKWPRGDRADLFCKRGVTAHRLGRSREAMEALKIALEFDPAHLDALEGLIDAAGEPPLEEDRAAVDGALAAARAAAPAEAAALAHLDRLTGRALERRFALEPAAEAYARAAAAQPADLAMLAPLVALHVTWRAWPEAAAALRAFSDRYAPAAVEDADARHRCVEALMREGALWTDLAGEPARGAACFKRVRVLAPERHDAAWRQAECHVLQGDFAEARRLMRAVLAPTRAIPPADHAQALFYLGRIEALGFGDEAEAERQYRRALDVDPRHAGALLALLKGLDARGDAEGLAKALARGRSRIEAVPEGPAAAALRTFAAGLHLREGELASARALLDPMASGHGPGFRAARFALVQIHERAGDGRGALRPLLTLLDDDVTDVDALQTLAELLARQGDPERRFQVLSVLALFRALDADQRAELDRLAQGARKRHERPRPLPDDVLAHQVVHPSFNSPLVRLAGLCAPQLAARFDPGPRPILGPDTAVTRRHPFAFRLRALQVLLGVDRFQLHFEPAYGEPVGVWPGDPALVVLGGPALEAPPAEQVGHVARALFYVRSGLAGLFNLGYRRRLALFGTLDALFVPGAAEMDAAQALIDAVPDAVAAEIKRVVDATGRMTLPTAFTGEAVMAGVSASADRASLLAGGELRAAAEGLLRTAESGADVPEGDDLTWAVRSAPRLRDLVKFALSEAYGQARHATDLAIPRD